VRRLLILLRRLAQRDGAEFVFQSNTTGLRYAVQRRFQDILANLFMLGAFAGDTQDEGFRVVTDSSVNLPETVDQGRFIVELRVAPSLPLEFLTVRLVQTGGEILLTEEF
jgi:phage tail sheath protein FI